jgi:hypothetical protein
VEDDGDEQSTVPQRLKDPAKTVLSLLRPARKCKRANRELFLFRNNTFKNNQQQGKAHKNLIATPKYVEKPCKMKYVAKVIKL